MEFQGTRRIEATGADLWELISDPEVLVSCVPGAKDVTMVSERKYTGVIERSFAGLTVEMDGEVELTELDPPDRITVAATGTDRITKTVMNADGDLLLETSDDGLTELAYDMTMEFTGKLPAHLLKSRINKDIGRFFDNVQDAAEDGVDFEEEQPAEEQDDEGDDGGLLSRF